MRKCPYWIQWLPTYDKNRQLSKCNKNNRNQKHLSTHRGLHFIFLWQEVCSTMKRRDSWRPFQDGILCFARLIFIQNGNIQDRIYRYNSDLPDAYHYIRRFRGFPTKTTWWRWMDFRERLVQDPSLIVQPGGNELCSFQRPQNECMPLFMLLRWRHFHVRQEWLEMLKQLPDSSTVR